MVCRRREMHLGTTADFLAQDNPCRRLLLARLAEGLLALCEDVEGGRLAPDVRLTGTTDLLRDDTARRPVLEQLRNRLVTGDLAA